MEIELTIQRKRRPLSEEPDTLLDYLLSSLGYSRGIEKYRAIVKKLIHNNLTSTQLSEGLAKRTTTIYYINKLMKGGLVVKRGVRYELREPTFERLVEEIRRDVERVFEDLILVARKLDEMYGLRR